MLQFAIMWLGLAMMIAQGNAQALDYGSLEALFGEPVTTSATGLPQRVTDAPDTMQIITADEIRRSGAYDIPGVLRHVAGVDVLQWTNDDAAVAVRGYNQVYSPRLLVLVDGRQAYADTNGSTPWSTVPVELGQIRQIEVVEGPNSALFGFNAVGGVVNIITYNPLDDDVKSVSLAGGTQNLITGSAIGTFKVDDNIAFRIAAGGRSNDDFYTPQSDEDVGTRRGDERREINADGRLRLNTQLEVALNASYSDANQPEMIPHIDGTTPDFHMFYVRYKTYSLKADVFANTGLGLIQATLYHKSIAAGETSPQQNDTPLNFSNQLTVAQLQDIFNISADHAFRLGVEFRHNSGATTPITGGRVSYDVFSGSGVWQWTIAPELTLTNALRVDALMLARTGVIPAGYGLANADWNSRSLAEVSFNSGLVWRATEEDTVRATVARGVQLPDLVSFGAFLEQSPTGFVGGIPTLRPTVVTNYELGWDRTLHLFDGRFRLRAFYQTSDDVLALFGGTSPSKGLAVTPDNIGHSEARGIELTLAGTLLDDWRWSLSYTPEIIRDHFDHPLATTLVDFRHTMPVHVVNASLGWSSGRWEIDGYLRYESSFHGIVAGADTIGQAQLSNISAYVTIDGRIGYELSDTLTLALSGQNITTDSQRQTTGPAVERRIIGELTASL